MTRPIPLQPVEMTPDTMQMLEDRGLIIRLAPGRHPIATPEGETLGETIHASDPKYGPHMLIAVSVNRESFAAFGTHPDNEEFLLIGDSSAKTMFLAVALCMKDELQRKIDAETLNADDFVCLRVRYNDPEVSFFTMLKDAPHGEALAPDATGEPATFYVTESRDLPLDATPFGEYELIVADGCD